MPRVHVQNRAARRRLRSIDHHALVERGCFGLAALILVAAPSGLTRPARLVTSLALWLAARRAHQARTAPSVPESSCSANARHCSLGRSLGLGRPGSGRLKNGSRVKPGLPEDGIVPTVDPTFIDAEG